MLASFIDGSKYSRMRMEAIAAIAVLNENPKFKKLFLNDGLLINRLDTSGNISQVKLFLEYNPISRCLDGHLDFVKNSPEQPCDIIEGVSHVSIENAEGQNNEDSKMILKLYKDKDGENIVTFEGEIDKKDLMN